MSPMRVVPLAPLVPGLLAAALLASCATVRGAVLGMANEDRTGEFAPTLTSPILLPSAQEGSARTIGDVEDVDGAWRLLVFFKPT